MQSKIINILSIEMNISISEIEPTSTFEDLDMDSLDMVELVMELEHEFDCDIEDDEVDSVQTVQDLITIVENKVKN